MSPYSPNEGKRRTKRQPKVKSAEPSMSAPQPMPGKPAATYSKPPKPQQTGRQGSWQTAPRPQSQQPSQQNYQQPAPGWNSQYPVQHSYQEYSQMSYPQRGPSQGIPGGQLPQQQYSAWQQGYAPNTSQQLGTQQPSGRGWSQNYPVQPPAPVQHRQQGHSQPQQQNNWQGGYTVNQWAGGGYAPAYENMVADQKAAPPQKRKQTLDRATIFKLIAAAAAMVAALVLMVGLVVRKNQNEALHAAVAAYNDRYCQGVYVDGIHLGGMTRDEAYTAVQKSAQLKCDEWNVQLLTPDGVYLGEINSYHLGMTVNVDDALQEAWLQGHTGATVGERKAAMDALAETPYEGSTALPSGNTSEIDNILNAFADSAYIPAQDAYEIFDPSVNLGSPFTIVPEVVGQYLDVMSIKVQVYDMVSRMESGVITLAPTPIYPTVTSAQVAQRTALIATAYTAISTTSTENRNENIYRAAELINGTIIEPGKNFSFNGVVGPRTKNNGFYPATVYSYGKEEEGYGGGVCQVSSTMYWAAIRANLEIVKREQHGLKVNYTDLGFDATVNYDGRKIDFAFKNSTGSKLYIITKVMLNTRLDKNHYVVICDLYGAAPEPGVTYDIVAIEKELPMPEPTVVQDKKAEHVVYNDETYVEQGRTGTQVNSFKVKYVNGEEVERTPLYTDIYAPVQTVTYVGVSVRPLPTEEPWH